MTIWIYFISSVLLTVGVFLYMMGFKLIYADVQENSGTNDGTLWGLFSLFTGSVFIIWAIGTFFVAIT